MNDLGPVSTVGVSTADPCVCFNKTRRYRPPKILLQFLRIKQENRCYYHFPICSGPVECVAHLCHNPPCRNPNHLVGSCDACNKQISNQAKALLNRSVSDSVSVNALGEQIRTDEDALTKNRRTEPMFLEFAKGQLSYGPMDLTMFIRMAAKHCDVSVVTVKERYIPKEDNILGLLRTVVDRKRGLNFIELRHAPPDLEDTQHRMARHDFLKSVSSNPE